MSRSSDRWLADLDSMIVACERAAGYVEGMDYDGFLDDDRTIDAVVMNLIVLAEAVKGIPDDIRARYPAVPWQEIKAFRNRAAHTSQTVDLSLDVSIIWRIASAELIGLRGIFKTIRTENE